MLPGWNCKTLGMALAIEIVCLLFSHESTSTLTHFPRLQRSGPYTRLVLFTATLNLRTFYLGHGTTEAFVSLLLIFLDHTLKTNRRIPSFKMNISPVLDKYSAFFGMWLVTTGWPTISFSCRAFKGR